MKRKEIQLIPDWRRVLKKAHSIRWALASGALSAVECALPFVDEFGQVPHGVFAFAATLAAAAIPVARIVVQANLHQEDEDDKR